jgi:hypothetical protein
MGDMVDDETANQTAKLLKKGKKQNKTNKQKTKIPVVEE